MDSSELYSTLYELFGFYNLRIRWVTMFIETKIRKFPVPVLNGLRSAHRVLTK